MKYHKIVLAGGNGYLGTVLAAYYAPLCKEVVILSRNFAPTKENIKTVVWDGKTMDDWYHELDGADMLINLCGKNVNCRYNKVNREAIVQSRVVPTKLLGEAIGRLITPPRLWINVTSATIYRHAEDRPQTEDDGEIGDGFSIEVCKQWEAEFFSAHVAQTRQVALRMGIVLGLSDGVFPRLLNLVKMGLGGKQGNGKQYVAWVHELDVARSTEWLLDHDEMDGIVNCTAPAPVSNNQLMQVIRKTYRMPFGLPAPAWLLSIGALIIGTETELILKSRWVLPKRLTNDGFKFQLADINAAVNDIVKKD